MVLPKISVVIPAYNAQGTIAETVAALLKQSWGGPVEIIVVDDGSADKTSEVVQRYQTVRYLRQQNAGPASARNLGARSSSGDIILFTDSDCRPRPDWIARMVAGFSSDEIVTVGGSYGIANPSSVLARIIHGEILFRHHQLMPEFPMAFGSYNVAMRKGFFNHVGGFNTGYRNASGEDNDLSYKILGAGGRIRFLKDALVDHYHQTSWRKYLMEQFRHGFWRVRMYMDHPRMAQGDGYTFWKDSLEVFWVAAHSIVLVIPWVGAVIVGGLLCFEVLWGFIIMCKIADGVCLGVMMWLRAFARTLGFLAGTFYFFRYYINGIKNSKKV